MVGIAAISTLEYDVVTNRSQRIPVSQSTSTDLTSAAFDRQPISRSVLA